MWPEIFNTIAVGVGALAVATAAVINVLLTNRGNRKNREQLAQIAADQAVAVKLAAEISKESKEIKVSIDGRMDQMLSTVMALATAKAEAVAAAAAKVLRDENVVSEVATAVVDRIGEAADRAAQTIPATKP